MHLSWCWSHCPPPPLSFLHQLLYLHLPIYLYLHLYTRAPSYAQSHLVFARDVGRHSRMRIAARGLRLPPLRPRRLLTLILVGVHRYSVLFPFLPRSKPLRRGHKTRLLLARARPAAHARAIPCRRHDPTSLARAPLHRGFAYTPLDTCTARIFPPSDNGENLRISPLALSRTPRSRSCARRRRLILPSYAPLRVTCESRRVQWDHGGDGERGGDACSEEDAGREGRRMGERAAAPHHACAVAGVKEGRDGALGLAGTRTRNGGGDKQNGIHSIGLLASLR
ncbi:hypothetical protein B0H12DRAFT_442921 [Mycena haematopus]|nr:hypothetical protein B0H12DRAFT_442921 [Mycena haematopus]